MFHSFNIYFYDKNLILIKSFLDPTLPEVTVHGIALNTISIACNEKAIISTSLNIYLTEFAVMNILSFRFIFFDLNIKAQLD